MKKYKSSYELLMEQLEKENRIIELSEQEFFKIFQNINNEIRKWEVEEGYKYPKIKLFLK